MSSSSNLICLANCCSNAECAYALCVWLGVQCLSDETDRVQLHSACSLMIHHSDVTDEQEMRFKN